MSAISEDYIIIAKYFALLRFSKLWYGRPGEPEKIVEYVLREFRFPADKVKEAVKFTSPLVESFQAKVKEEGYDKVMDKARKELLELYDKFKAIYIKYLKSYLGTLLTTEERRILGEILKNLSALRELREEKAYLNLKSEDYSPLIIHFGRVLVESWVKKLNLENVWQLERFLEDRCIAIRAYWASRKHTYYELVILGPALEEDFIQYLGYYPPTIKITIPSPKPPLEGQRPTRDILEFITANVLNNLGFHVQTNIRKPTRHGLLEEVDVWAEKLVVPYGRFRVYVSCKNWDKAVDRRVIDEEFGRVMNLKTIPHMKILVVKELTEPAKRAAEADGFLVIELREKAHTENAKEIHNYIYEVLNQVFTSIAPPYLQQLAQRVTTISKELEEIAKELTKLTS